MAHNAFYGFFIELNIIFLFMESPKNLQHKPLVSVNDYDQIDGQYRTNTDAKALSIGIAQYDEDEIAMKVWRHTGERWSRQSEELPLHRNLDLTILLLRVLFDEDINPDSFLIKTKNQFSEDQNGGIAAIREYYKAHDEILRPRLKEIKRLLDEM